ncbi:30S ribosomal protein S17 [Fluviispira multicolorata]|uniref:30S ribosomal protein S17 n=1 Tax=Fluviispira multicolorata TaxID=2654512 RepID=A0A833N3Z9_9BACT|nr:30S ribosomal protein S17 [Fluviispira multicolorata]KAB8029746.1 30S ribosomal protein S17 [Fluviispira multicolorata]
MENAKITKNPIRGRVVAVSKDTKTVKVEVPRVVPNGTYGKRLHLHTSVFADTSGISDVVVGKDVDILPCSRISKSKSWKIVSVVSR